MDCAISLQSIFVAVQPSREDGDSTNFQRASVTLDASVKIYGSRVDSVHTIAFQTLSGLSRSAVAAVQGELKRQPVRTVSHGLPRGRRHVEAGQVFLPCWFCMTLQMDWKNLQTVRRRLGGLPRRSSTAVRAPPWSQPLRPSM